MDNIETWAGKTPTADEWREILEQHAQWVRDDGGSRAVLTGAVLRTADLRYADLRYANLRDADLRGANLRDADLRYADLTDADLRDADLRDANLRDADLRDANLRDANLTDANLTDANLRDADLRGANLRDADLRGANLRDANLTDANLTDADLRDANLTGMKGELPIYRHQIVPESGAFEAWKQLRDGVIARLEIPADAGRVGGLIGRKCRAERATVVSLSAGTEGQSLFPAAIVYRVGETVAPDGGWDPSPLVECAPGIHFYLTRREAEEHQ